MLDIKFLRENPDIVKQNIKNKFQDKKLPLVDEVIELDAADRKLKGEAEAIRAEKNKYSKEIGALMAKGLKEEAEKAKQAVTRDTSRLAEIEAEEDKLAERIKTIMMTIPNIIDPSVPIGKDDSENVEVQKYGDPVVPDFEIPYHTEIMEKFNGIDLDSARRVAGNGFYYLMGDIARLIGYEYFEAKPLPVNYTHCVNQPKVSLERRLREYLAYRCGFNEIFTYPWIDEKYIKAAGIDIEKCVKLATPPSPELSILRSSLVPGLLETTAKNLRYLSEFKIFEMTEVYEKGEYHESTMEETLPIHKKMLSGAIVGKNPKEIFFELKGVLENIASYNHMEGITFKKDNKPSWADKDVYLNIYKDEEEVGSLSLVSVKTMNESGIKRTNIAVFEINFDKLVPFKSRDNEYKRLPLFPLVEKDLSLLVNKPIKHGTIITKVHHPSKKISISVIPIVLSPIITPIITKIIPHKIFFILFISISPIFILFMHSIVCNL